MQRHMTHENMCCYWHWFTCDSSLRVNALCEMRRYKIHTLNTMDKTAVKKPNTLRLNTVLPARGPAGQHRGPPHPPPAVHRGASGDGGDVVASDAFAYLTDTGRSGWWADNTGTFSPSSTPPLPTCAYTCSTHNGWSSGNGTGWSIG